MGLTRRVFRHHVPLEFVPHARCAPAAHANEANAPARQTLDGRDTNVLRKAADHHHAFVERQVDDSVHRGWLIGSSLPACLSKWSPSSFSALAPALVRDCSESLRHAAACSRRLSALSPCVTAIGPLPVSTGLLPHIPGMYWLFVPPRPPACARSARRVPPAQPTRLPSAGSARGHARAWRLHLRRGLVRHGRGRNRDSNS